MPDPGPRGERLESWKAIASYLRRDTRTAQRWEKTEGLPVYRLPNARRGGVFAYAGEIDAWWDNRKVRLQSDVDAGGNEPTVEQARDAAPLADPKRWRKSTYLLAAGLPLLLVAIAAAVLLRDRPAPGPKITTFIDYPGYVAMASFSPGGNSVAFVWNRPGETNEDIYIRGISDGSLRQFAASPDDDFSPAWSPDGKTIAFLRKVRNQEAASLFVQPVNGGPARKILEVPRFNQSSMTSLCWTADSKWLIASAQDRAEEPVGLYRISPEDGHKTRLTLPPTGQIDMEPALSPDDRMLAFIRAHGQSVTSVLVAPLSPDYMALAEPRQIPTFFNLRLGSPQWQADGKGLFFVGPGAAVFKVALSRYGTPAGTPVQLPFAGHSGRSWIYRPDYQRGRLIVGTARDEISIRGVPLQNSASTRTPSAVGSPENGNSSAQISPDGRMIAFETVAEGGHEIAIANIDGSGFRRLTSFGGPNTGSPSWSPDGRWLAFDSRTEGHPHVYLVPAGGGTPKRITTALADNNVPVWSRDGKSILYVSTRTGVRRVWRQPVDGGEPVPVTAEDSWGPVEALDGQSLYFQGRSPAGYVLKRLEYATGHVTPIVDGMSLRAFTVTADGVYYVPQDADLRSTIQYAAFNGGKRQVATIGSAMPRPLSVSPDGSFLLYSQVDGTRQSLLLIENFR